MSRKIKALVIIAAIIVASVIAIKLTTKEQPFTNRGACTTLNKPSSGYVDDDGCPYTDAEYEKINDYISSGIFKRQPVGSAIFVVAFFGSIATLIYGLKKPKVQ